MARAGARIIDTVRHTVAGLHGSQRVVSSDPQAALWVVRVVLSLLYWPVGDSATERRVVQRFVAPAFTVD